MSNINHLGSRYPPNRLSRVKDLERDFQILKATGIEPQDHHFKRAKEIFVSIGKDADVSGAQSYNVKTAYGEGDPPSGVDK